MRLVGNGDAVKTSHQLKVSYWCVLVTGWLKSGVEVLQVVMVNARGNDAQVVKISLARDYPQPSERGSDLDHSERDGVAVTVDGVDAVGPPCGLEISERRKEHLGLARKG